MPIITKSGGQAAVFNGTESCCILTNKPLESANGYNYEVCCKPGNFISDLNETIVNSQGISKMRPWVDYSRRVAYIYKDNAIVTDNKSFNYCVEENNEIYFGTSTLTKSSIKGGGTNVDFYPVTTIPLYDLNDKFFNATTIDALRIHCRYDGSTDFYGPNNGKGPYEMRHHRFVGISRPMYIYQKIAPQNDSLGVGNGTIRKINNMSFYKSFGDSLICRDGKYSVKVDGVNVLKTNYSVTKKDLDLIPRQMFYYCDLYSVVGLVISNGWFGKGTAPWGEGDYKYHKFYAVNNGDNYFNKYVNTSSYFYGNVLGYLHNKTYFGYDEYSNNSKSGYTKMVTPSTSDWYYQFWKNSIWKDYKYEAPSVSNVEKGVMFFGYATDYFNTFNGATASYIVIKDETATSKYVERQKFPYLKIPKSEMSSVKGIYTNFDFTFQNADFLYERTYAINTYWCRNLSSKTDPYCQTACYINPSNQYVYDGGFESVYNYQYYTCPKYCYSFYPFGLINSESKNYEVQPYMGYIEPKTISGGVESGTLISKASTYETNMIIEYSPNSTTTYKAIKGSSKNRLTNSGLFIDAIALYKTLEGWGLVSAKNSGASTDVASARSAKSYALTNNELNAMYEVITGNTNIKCYMGCLGTNNYKSKKPQETEVSQFKWNNNINELFVNEFDSCLHNFDTFVLPFLVYTQCEYSALHSFDGVTAKYNINSGHIFRAHSSVLYSSDASNYFNVALNSWQLCKNYNYSTVTGCSPK